MESSCRLTLDDGVWMFAHWLAVRRELDDSRCYRANIVSVSAVTPSGLGGRLHTHQRLPDRLLTSVSPTNDAVTPLSVSALPQNSLCPTRPSSTSKT